MTLFGASQSEQQNEPSGHQNIQSFLVPKLAGSRPFSCSSPLKNKHNGITEFQVKQSVHRTKWQMWIFLIVEVLLQNTYHPIDKENITVTKITILGVKKKNPKPWKRLAKKHRYKCFKFNLLLLHAIFFKNCYYFNQKMETKCHFGFPIENGEESPFSLVVFGELQEELWALFLPWLVTFKDFL